MQKLIVHNFRQISNAAIEVAQYLVLIGEQASGKSTIAKLIYFFKSLPQDYFDIIYQYQTTTVSKIEIRFIHTIQDKFNQYFGSADCLAADFSIRYYYDVDTDSYIELTKSGSLHVGFQDSFRNGIALRTQQELTYINKDILAVSGTSFAIQEKRNNANFLRLKNLSGRLFFDRNECMYFPAGRNITVSYPEQFQLLFYGALRTASVDRRTESNTIDLVLMKDFIGYSKLLVDYFASSQQFVNQESAMGRILSAKVSGILHGSYSNDSGYERINYNEKEFVPLKISSSGQQESIRIIQDLIYVWSQGVRASRIIEECETHLYPIGQKLLVELMVLVSNKAKSQMILTTHSPFILAAFNSLLYYHKVLVTHPGKASELAEYFGVSTLSPESGERLDVSPDALRAYALKSGADDYCKPILDAETHLIGENYIDEASEKVYDDFEYLYNMI